MGAARSVATRTAVHAEVLGKMGGESAEQVINDTPVVDHAKGGVYINNNDNNNNNSGSIGNMLFTSTPLGRCENPEPRRNIVEYDGIIQGISRNMPEYQGISRNMFFS